MQDAPCLLVDMGRADTGIFIKPESEIIDMTGYANQLKDIPWAYLEVLSRVVPGVPGSMLREAGDVLPPLPKQHKEFLSDIPTKKGRAYGKGYFQYANTPVFEDTPKDIPPVYKNNVYILFTFLNTFVYNADMKTFRELFEERGLTPSKAAKVTGMPSVTIASHYYGVRKISPESAIKYEKLLGIPRWETRPDLWSKPE